MSEPIVKHDTVDLVNLIDKLIEARIELRLGNPECQRGSIENIELIRREIIDCLRERDHRGGILVDKKVPKYEGAPHHLSNCSCHLCRLKLRNV